MARIEEESLENADTFPLPYVLAARIIKDLHEAFELFLEIEADMRNGVALKDV